MYMFIYAYIVYIPIYIYKQYTYKPGEGFLIEVVTFSSNNFELVLQLSLQ